MAKITNNGEEEYAGWDGDTLVRAAPGEEIEVSDEKAAQLLEDFPDLFGKAKSSTAKKSSSSG